MSLDPIQVGSFTIEPELILLVLAGLGVLALFVLAIVALINTAKRRREAEGQDAQLTELKVRLTDAGRNQRQPPWRAGARRQ